MQRGKQLFILLADKDDMFLTDTTLQELGYHIPVTFFSRFDQLIGAMQNNRPSMILIDFNLQPESGLDLLKTLKSDKAYRSIPVVVLMDSPRWQDYEQCYLYGASTVIKKPDSKHMTAHKIRTFFDYWLDVAETQQAV